ncbi:MAG: hypothetical protein WC246_03770 [Candidatus Paceibacterota bacterium]|jgi:hypothetical protein
MNIKAKKLVSACVTAGAFIGLAGISMAAEAGSWWGGAPKPFSVTCQSSTLGTYVDCGTGPDGSVSVVVPKSLKNNTCFYLTDVTAVNNNPINGGGRQVDIREGNSRANPAKVVYFLPYNPNGTNGNGGSTTVQDFQTPIAFEEDLYVDVHFPNNNVWVTLSGYYDHCTKK